MSGPSRLVIAHRGASAYEPENTMRAYELAVEQRADMIEVDLHRTRDGAVVIAHDETLERLGGRGEIADALADEIRALDAGGGQRVPLLDELLDAFASRVPFNLELKRGTRATYAGLERIALDAVRARGVLEATLFSSFFDPVLRALRAEEPAARLALLVSPRAPERIFERAAAVAAQAINPHDSMTTPELVEKAHAEGLTVNVYTVDDPGRMRELLAMGVDGIFSNRPDLLRSTVDALEAAHS